MSIYCFAHTIKATFSSLGYFTKKLIIKSIRFFSSWILVFVTILSAMQSPYGEWKRFPHSMRRRVIPVNNQMQIPLYRFTTKMSISMQNALKTICKQFSFQCGPMSVFVCLLCPCSCCARAVLCPRIRSANKLRNRNFNTSCRLVRSLLSIPFHSIQVILSFWASTQCTVECSAVCASEWIKS